MKQQLNFSIDFNQVQTPKRFCAKQNLCTILRWVTLILPIVFCSTAWAQQANMRYVASENGVFVYHFEQVPLGKGWNIYKKTAEANDYVKLNDTTIKGATYPAELVGALGDEYFRFAALMQSRNERDFFLSLQANRDNATLLSFLSPKIAKATGKLFVDNSTKPGDRVTYKIEFVDDLDRPTGKTIEKSFTIQTFTAVQPSKLVVANEGYTLKVNWEYPKRTAENDLVMHFLIMVKKANERFFESMVTDFVLRDDIKTTYTTSFQLEELNQNIEVYVVAVDATEQHGPQSTPVTYFVKDNIPPAQINEIRATMRNGQGLVTWDMVADLDLKGYQLERSTHIEKGYVPVQKGLLGPTETFFVDQTIVEGVNYFYRIAALDESGNRSAWSASVLLQVPNISPPEAPSGFTAKLSGDKAVQLNWRYPNPPKDFKEFLVMRRQRGNSGGFLLLSKEAVTGLTWLDKGPDAGFVEGQYYDYALCAMDSARNTSDTIYTSAQLPNITPPQAPAFVNVTLVNPEQIQLNWNASASGDVVGYRVYRKSEGAAYSLLSGKELVPTIRFRDEQLTLGATYTYAIAAVDSTGLESDKQEAQPIVVQTHKGPRSVRNVQLIPQEQAVLLRWEPVAGEYIAGYVVESAAIATGVFEVLTPDMVTANEWRDSKPIKGHWYRVRCFDTFGNQSRASDPVQY